MSLHANDCGTFAQHWLLKHTSNASLQHCPEQTLFEAHSQVWLVPPHVKPFVQPPQSHVPPQPSGIGPHFPEHTVAWGVFVQQWPLPSQTSPAPQHVPLHVMPVGHSHACVVPLHEYPLAHAPQSYVPPQPSDTVPHFPLHAVACGIFVQHWLA